MSWLCALNHYAARFIIVRILFFNDEKDFGFIVQDEGGPDPSVHRNETVGGERLEGDEVRFHETTDDWLGKSKATHVTGERIPQFGEGHTTILAPSGDDGADGVGARDESHG